MFLSIESYNQLALMFDPRILQKKILIPIGVHELTIKEAEMRKTKNGGDMLVISIVKPRDVFYHDDVDKVTYRPIGCYHVASRYGTDSIEDWYTRFTSKMSLNALQRAYDKFSKKPKFKAVVGIQQRPIEKLGSQLLDGHNRPVYMWESFIESVHRLDSEVVLGNDDYVRLFKYVDLNPQPIEVKQVNIPF